MPYGMGPVGWFAWPYMTHWMRHWHPWYGMPYSYPFAPFTKEDEVNFLESQAKILEDELTLIKKRMEELKKEK